MFWLIIFLLIILSLINPSIFLDLCEPDKIITEGSSYLGKNISVQNCACRDKLTCFRKCCKPGYFFDHLNCTAFPKNAVQNLSFLTYNFVDQVNVTSNNYIVGVINCSLYETKASGFYMQNNGSVYIPNFYRKFTNNDEYCVDYDSDYKLHAFLCVPESSVLEVIGAYMNVIGMLISMPFLFATFLVLALLPQRNFQMKALMCYVFSLLMSYISLVSIHLYHSYTIEACEFIGLCCIFWFNLSFLWMNVICINIYFTFSGFEENLGKNARNKRFYKYSAYALGVASLHIIVLKLINLMGDKEIWYHPGIGDGLCFIQGQLPLLMYFYGPMAIILIINIILFTITATKIRIVQKENKIYNKDNSKLHNKNKKKFILYLKLMIAMGLNWSMDVISWVVSAYGSPKIPIYVWFIPDFCNALYGVFIFFLFIFKRKIFTQLQKRYYTFIGKPEIADQKTQASCTDSVSLEPKVPEELELDGLK